MTVLIEQIIFVAIVAAWTIGATALVFGALKALGQLRVSREHEVEGLDLAEHGVETYPEFGVEDSVVTDGGMIAYERAAPGTGGVDDE